MQELKSLGGQECSVSYFARAYAAVWGRAGRGAGVVQENQTRVNDKSRTRANQEQAVKSRKIRVLHTSFLVVSDFPPQTYAVPERRTNAHGKEQK